MKKPQPLHSILKKTLNALEMDVPLKVYSIWEAWNEIVGDSVAAQSQPRSIRNQILWVEVSHSTWMQQLHFLKPTLLEKINSFLGESLIRDIRFKLGKIFPPVPSPQKTLLLEDEKIDKETLNQIERMLQKIEDQEVKKSLRKVLINSAKMERFKGKLK